MKKNIRVVCAIIFDKDRRVCITQRNDSALSGKWEFPGGKVEVGESDTKALIREIQEELETPIIVEKYFMTSVYEYPDFIVTLAAYFSSSHQVITHSSVHQQIIYVPIGELCAYSFAPADISIVHELIQYWVN